MRQTFPGCCARAASGHAVTAPPRSVMKTCKLHSVDPQTYFSDVLTKLLPAPRQPPPMRWSSQDNVELMTQKEVLNFKPAPPDCQPCTLSGNLSKQAVCKMGHSMRWGLLAHFAAGGQPCPNGRSS